MISEGSCDTEEQWYWKFSFAITAINYILQLIRIQKAILNGNNISQYYRFFKCIFDQINAAVMSIRDFF